MSEYGSGISFGQARSYDKERIKMALQGKLVSREGKDGFEYDKGDKEDCKNFILDAYDESVYQCYQAIISARALERMLFDLLPERSAVDFLKYMQYAEEERRKLAIESPYVYEGHDEHDAV